MKSPRILLVLVMAGLCTAAPACMNDYVPNVAAIQRSKTVLDQLQKHVFKEPWDVRRDRLRKELAAGGDYRVKNDLATSLAHTKEAAEAVKLLQEVEAEKPGLYATASNLGTAYELAGDDEQALVWIREGIKRNPRAHEGTEWLHVRILEAKLAIKKDPEWFETNSVLGPRTSWSASGPYRLNPGPLKLEVTGNRGETLSPEQVKAALIYQLHERLQFVDPPDAIVGTLLYDLGMLLSDEPTGRGGAYDVFNLSAQYLKDLPGMGDYAAYAVNRAADADRFGQRTYIRPFYQRPWFFPISATVIPLLVIYLKRRVEKHLSARATATHA